MRSSLRAVLSIASMIFSFSLFAQDRLIPLNDETVDAGVLSQTIPAAALETITLERNALTPKKVNLEVSFLQETEVCAETGLRQVLVTVPPSCVSTAAHQCYSHSYYTWEEYCKRYDKVNVSKQKTIHLDFQRANKLKDNEIETFSLNVAQKTFQDIKLDVSATADETKTPYKIKASGLWFMEKTIVFDAD